MRTMIYLLVATLLLAGCGTQEPSESAIQTAIAETREAQASTSPQSTVQSTQDTPAATETTPPPSDVPLEPTPLPPTLEPTQPAESQEVQAESDVPGLVFSSPAESFAIGGGKIFVDPGDSSIGAFDIKTGEPLWVANAAGKVLGADPDLVYAGPAELRVDALDAGSGEFRWRFLSQEPAIPLAANGKFVLLAGNSIWHVLDKSNGNVVSTPRAEKVWDLSMCAVKIGSNSIVAGDKYGRLSDDGHLEWLRSDVERPEFCEGMLLYIRTDPSGGLEAIDENTGSPLWKAGPVSLFGDIRSVFHSTPYFSPARWGGDDCLPRWDRSWKVCGTENVYVYMDREERWTLVALSKATGELRWNGLDLTKNAFGGLHDRKNAWLGEADGMLIYSSYSYGWTQAYGATDHAMIWENPHVILGEVVGVVDGILVGTEQNPDSAGLGYQPRVIVGLDPKTGKELWRSEPGTMLSIQLMQERVLYVLERQRGIWFIEPQTGEVMVQIPFDSDRDYNVFYATDGMIVADSDDELAVIRP